MTAVGGRDNSITTHRVKSVKRFEYHVGGECTVRMASGSVVAVGLSPTKS